MNLALKTMLEKYNCQTEADYINALKEIFQEIALLGLWRSKFFEQAAFYGGTASRILYGLDRFSEGMDFTLLQKNKDFSLDKFNSAIKSELSAFGFEVEVRTKEKNIDTSIESAFIKANTLNQFINIKVPEEITQYIHKMSNIKIKMEVDTDPPGNFDTEVKQLFLPIPYSVLTLKQEDLFAGKLHAVLCRQWKKRIKGRDWYDFYWYVSRNIPVNLKHLETRMIQSKQWPSDQLLTETELHQLMNKRINEIDFELAKQDVLKFIKDRSALDFWSKEFFMEIANKIQSY